MKKPVIRISLSILLMLAGVAGLVVVFLVLPWMAREGDFEWMGRHSERGQWEHIQNRIRWSGWVHDDFDPVGKYGGNEWAGWIIERLPGEKDPEDCGAGHKLSTLQTITNQSPGAGYWPADLPLWQAWWEQNRDKSQEQWIVDGFAAEGVVIHQPPVKEDWPVLLKVLGHDKLKDAKSVAEEANYMPPHLKYNAFRCLRDSEFNPVRYALEAELTPESKAGLLAFRDMETERNYWDNKPGRVFGAGDREAMDFGKPRYLKPAFRWRWGAASALVAVTGLWLWRRKSRLGFPPPRMK